ncbi:MAG: ATP-dependent DNA helicase RecG [Negativicutes bacterium]
MNLDLSTSIRYLRGVGNARANILAKLNIFNFRDLLEYYPVRYEDRSSISTICQLKMGDVVSIYGLIAAVTGRKIRAGLHITTVRITDAGGTMNLVWFNQQFREKQFHIGSMISAYGKVERNNFGISMTNPEYELFDIDDDFQSMGIVPIYRLTEGITGKTVRMLLSSLLESVTLKSALPDELIHNLTLMNYHQAVKNIHQPTDATVIAPARERLVFEEFFALQACILMHRIHNQSKQGVAKFVNQARTAQFLELLPFQLTDAQREVWQEIKSDLQKESPMERLIQGDVGSGKTVISALALICAVENGYQATLMAPTEVLATQHFNFLQNYFSKLDIKVVLLTGKSKTKTTVLESIAQRQVDIVIGTHAIIQDKVEFAKLGLVVTDEQHRFGVEQRERLKTKGNNPHMLVMTATPIPRTLALTVFGDLDISTIKQLPQGRKPVKTYLRDSKKRSAVYDFALNQIKSGRQVFVVCPLIEESEKLQVQSAITLYNELSTSVFRESCCVLLHGQMKQQEKDAAMRLFSEGSADVMVATTVIEVGIDIPNATVMLIEGADRFGLSQLHQLRGRVGRSAHQSYCILLSESGNQDTLRRLSAFTDCNDGFTISDLDLQFRGIGQFFGLRQHGLSDLKIGDIIADYPVMIKAKAAVVAILEQPKGQAVLTNYINEHFTVPPELLKN